MSGTGARCLGTGGQVARWGTLGGVYPSVYPLVYCPWVHPSVHCPAPPLYTDPLSEAVYTLNVPGYA